MSFLNSTKFKELLDDRQAWVDANNRKHNQFDLNALLSNLYSDSSHFLFEILQNAEDAKAKHVKFYLTSEEIRIWHNGVDFNFDDIKSITSINKSTKVDDFTQIGKHGVGFKSVLSLTKSPVIRSSGVEFEIRDIVLPNILDNNYNGEKTEIILPFNREDLNVEQTISNIYNRITNLGFRNILFLNNIQKIEWEFEENSGIYTKSSQDNYQGQPVSRRTINYSQNVNSEREVSEATYLVFSEKIKIEGNDLQTDIAYGIVDNDVKDTITRIDKSKICVFFETEHETHLNFLIQAMFSTTSTRERIPLNPEDTQNFELLKHAGDITANSLKTLKALKLLNIDVLNMMPLDEDEDPILNMMYEKIKARLCSKIELLPNQFGSFGNSENSMLAATSWIEELLNQQQCEQLFGKPYFIEKCQSHTELYNYFKHEIGLDIIDSRTFAESLTKEFLEAQSDKWIMDFYKAVHKVESIWKITHNNQSPPLLDKFIIRGDDGKHYNIRDENGDEAIYLFEDVATHDFPTVKRIICKDEDILVLLKDLKIKQFDKLAFIKKYIFPNYKAVKIKVTKKEFRSHIKTIIEYYDGINTDEEGLSLNLEKKKFLRLINDQMYFQADFNKEGKENHKNWSPYKYLYFPDDRLKTYFDDSETEIGFVKQQDLDKIQGYKSFLSDLGVQSLLRPIPYQLERSEKFSLAREKLNLNVTHFYDDEKNYTFKDLDIIMEHMSSTKSSLIWDSLVNLQKNLLLQNQQNYFQGSFSFSNRTQRYVQFPSHLVEVLQENSWLYHNGKTYSPSEILYEDLNEEIYKKDEFSEPLIDLLNFKIDELIPEEVLENLSEEQRKKISLLEQLEDAGVTDTDLASLIAEKKQEQRKTVEEIQKANLDEIYMEVIDSSPDNEESDINDTILGPKDGSSKHSTNNSTTPTMDPYNTENNLQRSIATDRTQLSNIHDLLEKKLTLKTLLEYQNKLDKYSYAWFKLFLNIEYESAKQNRNDKKRLKIYFSIVKSLNEKIILLKNPSINIPSFIEDLPGVNLIIRNKNKKENVKVDVVSLRDNTIKLKLISSIQTICINEATTAELDVNDPFFLIKELIKEFYNLEIDEDHNFKNDAEQNIEFIFGPPGTGKTTVIANRINKTRKKDKEKILILTPTNKSADVLSRKIISTAASDYPDWLIRFGNSAAVDDEMNSIVKDRAFSIEDLESYVVISTIVRLPYDGFSNIKLSGIHWDKVYFDESSMIHIAYAAYAMKKLNSKKFYFAGDPCQITPIMQFQDWQNENIYEMFELIDFVNPTTKPKNFPVKTLSTQYRSMKDIGDLFSHYAYSGQVDSMKKISERNPLHFIKEDFKAFTLIRFPVSKSERLLNPIRLVYSPYHIYSAIYSIEIAKFISSKINEQWSHKNDDKEIDDELDLDALNKSKWTIGIICPYKAQSSIVERLIPDREGDDKCIILSGTVHSFQGDECDIIISLFNPPPKISPYISLNNMNIMNVSISRAKQYLIMVLPDENMRFYEDLSQLIDIVNIIKEKYPDGYNEYTSDQMEEILFGEKNYIQTNSMVSKHQRVNRFNEADYRWEVRCDEEAVDIHISETTLKLVN